MGIGRRDYTWGFLNEAAGEGRYRESFMGFFSEAIDPWAESVIYTYTVATGYRLGINRIYVSSDFGSYNLITLGKNGVMVMQGYFTDAHIFDISDVNPLYFEAGDVLDITIQNRDDIIASFLGGVYGIKEYLI